MKDTHPASLISAPLRLERYTPPGIVIPVTTATQDTPDAPAFGERVEGIARRADGVEVAAAAYLYVGPIGDGVVIAGGDYAPVARARR